MLTRFNRQATLLSRRRAASESIKREIPLNNMLIPTSMPMAQAVSVPSECWRNLRGICGTALPKKLTEHRIPEGR